MTDVVQLTNSGASSFGFYPEMQVSPELCTPPPGGGIPFSLISTYTLSNQALVRIALACFGPREAGESCETEGPAGAESGSPGHCLGVLLTYMWRRLHASAQLALNGVRAGRGRHRSNIQKVIDCMKKMFVATKTRRAEMEDTTCKKRAQLGGARRGVKLGNGRWDAGWHCPGVF